MDVCKHLNRGNFENDNDRIHEFTDAWSEQRGIQYSALIIWSSR